MTTNPTQAEEDNVVLRYLKFIWALIGRIFKGGVQHRCDDRVQIKKAPKAVGAHEFVQPHPVQLTADGTGPLYYRHYRVQFQSSLGDAETIMRKLQADPGEGSAPELAIFRKTKGTAGELRVGDEFLIEITGPWNGPVRTIEVKPRSFTFATLEGHMEAGEISFQIESLGGDQFVFEIFSWARSKSMAVDLVYDKMKIAKQAQTEMWTQYCENLVKIAEGKQQSDVLIEDKKDEFRGEAIPIKNASVQGEDAPAQGNVDAPVQGVDAPWRRYESRLKALGSLKENFDITQREHCTQGNGWKVDSYACELPKENAGPPEAGASFAKAREVLENYEFPDPKLITGIFVPDDPLDQRIMLLRARFLIFTFYFGVRIGRIVDGARQTLEGEDAQVWGYSYHTLEGHFERGEITFEVWKILKTGQVQFKISAFSQPERIRNIFYRWGFRLFGRGLQLRFAKSSMDRMQRIVQSRLAV